MENNHNDQKVIDLLSRLKNDNNDYPSELLELRRQKYLRRAAQLGLGIGAGAGLKNALKGRGSGLPPAAGSWLEAALVVAIVAEASTAAFLYRDKLSNLVQGLVTTPVVQEVGSPPAISSPLVEISVAPAQTLTGTPTATDTPVPAIIEHDNDNVSGNNNSTNTGGVNTQASSTPVPKGNNGNHFGQTKQPPKATKDSQATKVPNNQGPNTKVPKNK